MCDELVFSAKYVVGIGIAIEKGKVRFSASPSPKALHASSQSMVLLLYYDTTQTIKSKPLNAFEEICA